MSLGQHLEANVDVQSIGSLLQSYLRVFDSTGVELAHGGDGFGDASLDYAATATGVYYVGVSDYSNYNYDPNTSGSGFGFTSGDYNLSLLVPSPASDANDSIATATPVSYSNGVPTSQLGLIFQPHNADLFAVNLNRLDSWI